MPAPTASERTLVARIAAEISWADTPDRAARTGAARTGAARTGAARTGAARAAADATFLAQADGDPVRAEHLRRAYFARLALRSAQSRRRAREARAAAVVLDQAADAAELALNGADGAA